MPFVNVPSTESADYINAQKSEFEDTYYVDNLNTLGAGGGGGGIGYLAVNNCSWNAGTNCGITINLSTNDIVSDVATYCSCSNSYEFTQPGTFLVNYCESVSTSCCSSNGIYFCFVGLTNGGACSCSTTTASEQTTTGAQVTRLGVQTTFSNVNAGDSFRIGFRNQSATAYGFSSSGASQGVLTIVKVA